MPGQEAVPHNSFGLGNKYPCQSDHANRKRFSLSSQSVLLKEATINAHFEGRGLFPFIFLALSLNPVLPNEGATSLLLCDGNRLE